MDSECVLEKWRNISNSAYSYGKEKMWDAGVRLLSLKTPKFFAFVENAIRNHLRISCPAFGAQALKVVGKILEAKMNKLWNNQVSNFRCAIKKCKHTMLNSPLQL